MAIVYSGRVFTVEVTRRQFPNGQEHEIAVVRHAPSVVLIPHTGDGRVILISQYRASLDRTIWEFPAGTLRPQETPESCAVRECEEEIGLVPERVTRIRGLFPAPGFCDEELIFFHVSELRPPPADSTNTPDDDEDIASQTFTIQDAKAMVERGEIIDLKTAYALTLI